MKKAYDEWKSNSSTSTDVLLESIINDEPVNVSQNIVTFKNNINDANYSGNYTIKFQAVSDKLVMNFRTCNFGWSMHDEATGKYRALRRLRVEVMMVRIG